MQSDELGRLVIERLRQAGLDSNLVAKFTGAAPSTVGSWFAKGIPPKGDKLNKLWHLLALAGVPSPEFDDLPPFGRYVGELLAYGLVTLKEAQEICGVGKENPNPQAVWNTVRGAQRPLNPMGLAELRELYGDSLQEAKDAWHGKLGAAVRQTASPRSVQATTPAATATDAADQIKQDRLLEIAQDLNSTKVLMQYLASDECTAEDREFVRDLLGPNGMFDFSNLASRLCGERARNQ